jgi:hypothetical protein
MPPDGVTILDPLLRGPGSDRIRRAGCLLACRLDRASCHQHVIRWHASTPVDSAASRLVPDADETTTTTTTRE